MRYIAVISLILFSYYANSQGGDNAFRTWKILAEIDYKKATDEYGEIYVPKFSEATKKLEGTKITLPGYIIPFEGMFKPDHIILSSLPIASCFFCGTGGPETVAEAHLKENVKYTAKLVLVTGTLELNDTDTNQLMYILRDAKIETN